MSLSDDKKYEFMHELDLLLSEYGGAIDVKYTNGEDVRVTIGCVGQGWDFDVDLGEGYAPPPSCATQGPGDDFIMGILKALRWAATDAGASLDVIADAITRVESGGEL